LEAPRHSTNSYQYALSLEHGGVVRVALDGVAYTGGMSVVFAACLLAAEPSLERILERLSEEAEVFAQLAPRVVARERLLHRGRRSPPRFRPRIGAKSIEAALGYVEREVISEYGWAALKDNPGDLREFRQVVTVDGRQVKQPEKARLALAMNMTSEDDRERKRMLQDFEKYGMIGAAIDFSQDILLFRRQALPGYEFSLAPPRTLGANPVLVVQFLQKSKDEGARVYHGRELTRVRLQGEIWVREKDLLPMRIILQIPTKEDGEQVLHSGEIDYVASKHGLLLPTAVRYRKTEGENLLVENFAFYNQYRMFKVETEVKFTPEEVTPEPQ